MTEKITVFVNGNELQIYRGMQVKHALISYDYALYQAASEGKVTVVDAHGFALGLEGALTDGSRIFSAPPSRMVRR